MSDPLEDEIRGVKQNAYWYGKNVDTAEETLKQYYADFYSYTDKLDILESANISIETSIGYFETARSELENRTEGSRSNQAKDLFDAVITTVSNLSISGVETINIYIATAMKILDEQWAIEFKNYEQNLEAYNESVTYLKNHGVASYNKKEQIYFNNHLI